MKSPANRVRQRQRIGFIAGLAGGAAALAALLAPSQERWHVRGPMNTGHEALRCESCHKSAPRSLRQQVQASVRYWVGLRKTLDDFGYLGVTNDICLGCHDRPNDRHTVFRFCEPRFAEARAKLQPQLCVSCHLEHRGRRVTLSMTTYCEVCHRETKLRKDPLDISHANLIALNQWESCLGCHDFHGNHIMKVRKVVAEGLPTAEIRNYFAGAPSPYAKTKRYKAKKEAKS
ncbi:cytochrome c3 family protein [Methylocaldum sp.]|uniref:cytochrome c3 family protein n=1 Tax=Methylocaldum sp. TaxID=1969727 RepID=UPI002D60BB48|nr:cytochrome c3 family protein [Methylocaldum sp.]HYE36302.1 cytochrome c3 family protein [Methylocaldum sp.]